MQQGNRALFRHTLLLDVANRTTMSSFGGSRTGTSMSSKKTLNGPNHDEWVRQKERERDDVKHLAMLKKKKEKRVAEKAKEVAQATFDCWVKKKSRYEKVQQLLKKEILIKRASEDESWREIGVALVACDCLVGTFDLSARGDSDLPSLSNSKPVAPVGGKVPASQRPLPSLLREFIQWSRAKDGEPRHCFSDVVVPIAEAGKLSNQVQELAEDYGRVYTSNMRARSSGSEDEDNDDDEDNDWKYPTKKGEKTKYVLNSLQYTPPLGRAPRTPLERVMEASNDVLNKLWMQRTKWTWKQCQKAVIERATKKMNQRGTKASGGEGKDNEENDDDEDFDIEETPKERQKRLERVLLGMSVGRLSKWVEKDTIDEDDKKKKAEEGDRNMAKKTHLGWAKRKNENIIVLPPPNDDDVAKMKKMKKKIAPRMDFSGRGVVRPKRINVMTNSVDMMMNSGLRVIHANPKNKHDLEDARGSLLKLGYVNKRNFMEEFDSKGRGEVDAEKLKHEKRNNPALLRVRALKDEKETRNSGKDYTGWGEQKTRVARAKKCLSCIDGPYEGENKSNDEDMRKKEWKRVGKKLKGVDTSLMPQYASWSKGYKTFQQCQTAWKQFEPKDIQLPEEQAMAMELTKDTLLKVIKKRRQFDWGAAFEDSFNDRLRRLEDRDERAYSKMKKGGLGKFEMKPKQLQTFFKDQGIALTGPEIGSMFAAFDENRNGLLSASEFMEFAKKARTAQINPNSDFWNDLPTLKKYYKKNGKWTDEQRNDCVQALEDMASVNLQAEAEIKMLEQGKPPAPPILKMKRSTGLTPKEQTSTLELTWAPGPGKTLPIFYVLEIADKSGKIFSELTKDPPHAKHKDIVPTGYFMHEELAPNTKYLYRLTAFNGFGPSTPTYASFTTLPIAPPAPRLDSSSITVDKCTVTLSWGEGEEYVRKLRSLRKVFNKIDVDGSGQLSKAEMETFKNQIIHPEKNQANPILREFVEWSGCGEDIFLTMFKKADENNDGKVSFDEFSKHLLRNARVNSNKPRVVDGGAETKTEDDHAAVATGTKFVLMQCIADEDVPFFNPVTAPTHKTSWKVSGLVPGQSYQYRVHAVNQDDEPGPPSKPLIVNAQLTQPDTPRLKRGKNGKLMIVWKEPPNLDMSTMLLGPSSTPARNTNQLNSSTSSLKSSSSRRSNTLRKSDSNALGKTKDKSWGTNPLAASATFNKGVQGTQSSTWMKKLAEWTNPAEDGNGGEEKYSQSGVSEGSVKRMFDRYDANGDGDLGYDELKHFLKDMGMPHDNHAIQAAMMEVDKNNDGHIKFDEFKDWWSTHKITYVLKRDAGTPESSLASTGGRLPGKPYYCVDYTLQDNRSVQFDIGGDSEYSLKPNTMYRFALMYRSRRSFSPLSQELQVCTPPGAPTQPVAVAVRAREVTLKWYPGPGGAAFKYVVLYKKLGKAGRGPTSMVDDGDEDGWEKCFEGSSTLARITSGIDADTAYKFKVAALNRQYTRGDTSLPTMAVTIRSVDEEDTTPNNVEDIFTIECTGDVVTGDTIVFTERVYRVVKPAINGKENNKSRKSLKSKSRQTRSIKSKLGVESSGSVRLSQSIEGSAKREFVTERTVAAVVFKETESLYSSRKGLKEMERSLSMQVIWCTASAKSDIAKKHILKPGAIISRKEGALREFEVFRCPWAQEDSRWTSSEEQTAKVLDNGLSEEDNLLMAESS